MDAREEILKVTLGKAITGGLLLVGFLLAILWRETLFQKWAQVAEELSKPALMALLGLVLIGAFLEGLVIAYLLYLLYRNRRKSPANMRSGALTPPLAGHVGMLGVLWDEHDNPCCPICKVLMSPVDNLIATYKCPNCHRGFTLKDDFGQFVYPAKAKTDLIQKRYDLAQRASRLLGSQ